MPKAINKLAKLRELQCVICFKLFSRHIAPSEIKSGRGKVCSKKCKGALNSLQKKTGSMRNCKACNKEFYARPSEDRRGYKRTYCSADCHIPTERGKAISTDGYYVIRGKKVHRIIMEECLGRKLLRTEIVHHINENKLDNRIENLQVVSRAEHNRIHFSAPTEPTSPQGEPENSPPA
jgi:hypothetical protein